MHHGFARVYCDQCGHDYLLAYSGFSLPGTYLATFAALVILYFPCLWSARFKAHTQANWVKFL